MFVFTVGGSRLRPLKLLSAGRIIELLLLLNSGCGRNAATRNRTCAAAYASQEEN